VFNIVLLLAGKSKTRELGIFPKSITVLSFCLHMLPKGQAATSKNQVYVGHNTGICCLKWHAMKLGEDGCRKRDEENALLGA
jgi:hypothetical protein